MIKKYYNGLYLGKSAIIFGILLPLLLTPVYIETESYIPLLFLPFAYSLLFIRKGVQINFKTKTIRPFISFIGFILGKERSSTDFPYYRKKIVDSESNLTVNGVYQSNYTISNKVLSIYDSKKDSDLVLIKSDEHKMKNLILKLEEIGIHKKKVKRKKLPFRK